MIKPVKQGTNPCLIGIEFHKKQVLDMRLCRFYNVSVVEERLSHYTYFFVEMEKENDLTGCK